MKGCVLKMTLAQIILGSVVLALSVAVIICVVLQRGKSDGLGAITGSAAEMDTFFSKNRKYDRDNKLKVATIIISIVLVVGILALNVVSMKG